MEEIKCSKCGSSQITANKKGFSTGRAIAGGLLTGNIWLAAAAGGAGMNEIEITCLSCGHTWKVKRDKEKQNVHQDAPVCQTSHTMGNARKNLLPDGLYNTSNGHKR